MKIQKTSYLRFDKYKSLNDQKPRFEHGSSKRELKRELKNTCKILTQIQEKMYAQGKYSVLICLQGRKSLVRIQ